ERDGSVSEVEVHEPFRDDVDALVVEAARRMRFRPATRDGEPIVARVQFRYRVAVASPIEEERDEERGPEPPAPAEGDPDAAHEEDEDGELEEDAALGVTAVVERDHEEGAAGRITLRGEELTTVPGSFGEPLRAVASLPGVAR